MGDLIRRQDAIEAVCTEIMSITDYPLTMAYEIAEKAIECMPSAQPEIIACGDCKHWICHDRRCGYWNHGVKPLDWCCHAERRIDE